MFGQVVTCRGGQCVLKGVDEGKRLAAAGVAMPSPNALSMPALGNGYGERKTR